MKNKKVLIGGIAVLGGIALLVYRFLQKRKSGQTLSYADSVKEDLNTYTSNVSNKVLSNASYPLKKGSKGNNVLVLQKWLNDKGYASPKLVTDGDFGAKTERAVLKMQNNPYDRTTSDYLASVIWISGSPYVKGQVTKDFYDIFVIKTKKLPIMLGSSLDLFK